MTSARNGHLAICQAPTATAGLLAVAHGAEAVEDDVARRARRQRAGVLDQRLDRRPPITPSSATSLSIAGKSASTVKNVSAAAHWSTLSSMNCVTVRLSVARHVPARRSVGLSAIC